MRILIAEDDSTSRKLLAAILEKSGYEVEETVDGSQAWERMQAPGAPEIAIIDWVMPGLDGPPPPASVAGSSKKEKTSPFT